MSHPVFSVLKKLMRERFVWPKIKKDIEKLISVIHILQTEPGDNMLTNNRSNVISNDIETKQIFSYSYGSSRTLTNE